MSPYLPLCSDGSCVAAALIDRQNPGLPRLGWGAEKSRQQTLANKYTGPTHISGHDLLKTTQSIRGGHEALCCTSTQFVSIAEQRTTCSFPPSPSSAPPLTLLHASAGLPSRAGCPIRAGAWASLLRFLWPLATEWLHMPPPHLVSSSEWLEARGGGAGKPRFLPGLGSRPLRRNCGWCAKVGEWRC